MEKLNYFEYKVSNAYSSQKRCLRVKIVDCDYEKALSNCNKHRELVNKIDSVWNSMGLKGRK